MNPWDGLSDNFDALKDPDEISPDIADNVFIAWPALFHGIEKVQPAGAGLTAFDLGCGTGSFSKELNRRGYQVSACDTSQEMIKTAKARLDQSIAFHVAGAEIAATLKDARFSLISSIMVLQFIPNIEETLDALDKAIVGPGGVIAMAAFNPDYVRANVAIGRSYVQETDPSGQVSTFMIAGESKIPLYMRTAAEYNALFKSRGYSCVSSKRPRFTRAFLEKYPKTTDTRYSEYLIMVFKKTHSPQAPSLKIDQGHGRRRHDPHRVRQ